MCFFINGWMTAGDVAKVRQSLAERGIAFFPPVLAQLLGRSKVAQAEVLGDYMVPGSFVAYALADLAGKLPGFQARGAVVAKRERAHLGLGVSRWPSLEALYSLAGLQPLSLVEAQHVRLPDQVIAVNDDVHTVTGLQESGFGHRAGRNRIRPVAFSQLPHLTPLDRRLQEA